MIFNPTYLKGGLIQKNGQQLGGSEGPWEEKPSALEGALRTGDFRNVGGVGWRGWEGGDRGSRGWKSLGCPGVPSERPKPPEQRPRVCRMLSLLVCVSCFASAAPLLHVFSLAGVGWWRVSRIPLCGMERTGGGGGPRARGLELASREARHWPSSQGLGPRRELPAPRHSLPLPPRAPWRPSLPAGPPPSQTAARGRGRSISEQRGPCGLQLKPRIPLSHRQVKRRVCAHAHRHARMVPGSPGPGLRAWRSVGGGDATGCLGAGLGGSERQGP